MLIDHVFSGACYQVDELCISRAALCSFYLSYIPFKLYVNICFFFLILTILDNHVRIVAFLRVVFINECIYVSVAQKFRHTYRLKDNYMNIGLL